MYDPRAWRALARGPEYIPPHTSIHEGAPIRPPPPYHAPTPDASPRVSATAPSSHIQGPPSPTSNKMARPQGFASLSTSKSPTGKFHRQKPHFVFPLDARPARASKTLTKLLDKLEDDQKRDIHKRISGHLNHDKVYEGLVKASQSRDDGQQQRRGRRGRPAAADDMPASAITIPLTPPNAMPDQEQPLDLLARPHTPLRSRSCQEKQQPLPHAPESPTPNNVISSVIHQKIRNPDRASILYHQYLDEAQSEATLLGKMHVASRYFDVLIQDFRLFAPLLSGIKTAYHDVVEQYITDLNELEALKRGLIVSIARHQAKAGAHDQLLEQVTQLQHEKDELTAQVRTLEHMIRHVRDSPSHGTLSRGTASGSHAHHGGHSVAPPPHHAPATISSPPTHGPSTAGAGVLSAHTPLAQQQTTPVSASVTFHPLATSPGTPPMSPRGLRTRTGSASSPSYPATVPASAESTARSEGGAVAEHKASVGSLSHGGSRPGSSSTLSGDCRGGLSRAGTGHGTEGKVSTSPLGHEVKSGEAGLGDGGHDENDGTGVELVDVVGS